MDEDNTRNRLSVVALPAAQAKAKAAVVADPRLVDDSGGGGGGGVGGECFCSTVADRRTQDADFKAMYLCHAED